MMLMRASSQLETPRTLTLLVSWSGWEGNSLLHTAGGKSSVGIVLQWPTSRDNESSRLTLICRVSQILCTTHLGIYLQAFYGILTTLATITSNVHLQWIPGHSKISLNKAVDMQAKEVAQISDYLDRPPISLEAARTIINRIFRVTRSLHKSPSVQLALLHS